MKSKIKKGSKKYSANTTFLKILVLSLIILVVVLLFLSLKKEMKSGSAGLLPSGANSFSEKSEDDLSQYTIPSDVITALNKAESTGNPVLGIRADGPNYHIPILMYHYIEHVQDPGDTIRISLNVLPETLDAQIRTLVAAGYTFITPSDMADILDGIMPVPEKPIILSFDDGYRDFYTGAFPILKKYNVRSVAYIITGFLNRPNYLTDYQLQEIAQSGIVEIGAHTVNHYALAGVSDQVAKQEIENSRLQLEQKLGIPIVDFAYPYGSFNLRTVQLTKEAGYRTAVATIPGADVGNQSRFFVNRLRPGASTGQSLLNLIGSSKL